MSTALTVTGTTWITPALKRIHFRSDDLSAFAGSEHTDRYVKIVFPKPGVTYPQPLDIRALRGAIPPEDMPDVRTYTALFPDVVAGTVSIDFVIHGDEGIAGPWAARAEPGDTLLVNGPGGAYRPAPDADWHLLAGDESALPAVSAALAALGPGSVARVVVQLGERGQEPTLPAPDGVDAHVTFVYRSSPDGGRILPALEALVWLPGRVHAFVHGEAQEVMHEIRPFLLKDRALPRPDVSVSGYWRRGRTEDGFRTWKAELASTEADQASR